MKLLITQRCEQGTPNGVMRFSTNPDGSPRAYALEQLDGGRFRVTHDARTERRRVEENGAMVRKDVAVTQTEVDAAIVDKMVACNVAKVEA